MTSGYATVLSGHLGPWFMDLVANELDHLGAPVVYVVLRPTLVTALPGAANGRATRATPERSVTMSLFASCTAHIRTSKGSSLT